MNIPVCKSELVFTSKTPPQDLFYVRGSYSFSIGKEVCSGYYF
jgi:hypothetical protein